MPQRIPSPNVIEVAMLFTLDGQQVENVYHYHMTLAPTTESMLGMAGAVKEWWIAHLQGNCPQSLALNAIMVTDLTTPTSAQVVYTTGLPITGANINIAAPSNVTVAVKWSTALRGRSFRGRTFHLGLMNAQIVANHLASGVQSILQNAYQELTDDPGIIEFSQFCVLSEVSNGAPRAEGICTPIISAQVDPTLDSQRRRLPGRGQ